MATYIPEALRRAVIERAGGRCEYCGKPQVSFFPHEVDHVIAQKHGEKQRLITWPSPVLNVIAIKAVMSPPLIPRPAN